MRILIVSNVITPTIARKLNTNVGISCGWVGSAVNTLLEKENIQMGICFPLNNRKTVNGKVGDLTYYSFKREINNTTKYSKKVEKQMKYILEDFKPDIVHIFGTEFPHSLSMVKAFNRPERTIIQVQGLVSYIEKHYYASLPYSALIKISIRDLITNNSVISQKKKFFKRSKYEIQAIKNVNHIVGRTHWDKICTFLINDSINYYSLNESLRDSFYNEIWDYQNIEKHSIFVSQGNYSIKGVHFMIEALKDVVERFPDAHLYIAGTNIIKSENYKDKLKRTGYSFYIENLIKKYSLKKHITFLGKLNEEEMVKRYLKSHVFVLPSSIENSPNSLGEAMYLGLPCIASDVGGVKSMIEHENEGLLYQYDATYMLAYYICELFEDKNSINKYSENARTKAKYLFDKQRNNNKLIEIYNIVKACEIDGG